METTSAVTTRSDITAAGAARLIDSAITAAERMGLAVAVAVTDSSGTLKAFTRMDGAMLQAVAVAQGKAYTSASTSMTTDAWAELLQAEPVLARGAVGAVDGLVAIGGGHPVLLERGTAGAIGVSGGHFRQDSEIAAVAVAEFFAAFVATSG